MYLAVCQFLSASWQAEQRVPYLIYIIIIIIVVTFYHFYARYLHLYTWNKPCF